MLYLGWWVGFWGFFDREVQGNFVSHLHSPVQLLQVCAPWCPHVGFVTTAGTANFCFPLILVPSSTE